jgi:serine/threonine protein phosphatase PrpC
MSVFCTVLALTGHRAVYSNAELDAVVTETVTRAFVKTDEDFLATSEHPEAGSTATTALIMGKRWVPATTEVFFLGLMRDAPCRIYLCNTGDSRSFVTKGAEVHISSRDHKPGRDDEARRIKEAGGFIFQNRIMGELAVSRAFGDKELKKPMIEIMGKEEIEQMMLRDAKNEG